MTTDLVAAARQRHTVKAYQPGRRISDEDFATLCELIRLSPSSVNLQPWHVVIASTDEGKARVAKAAEGDYSYNGPSIRACSHAFVFASRVNADEAFLQQLLDQEEADGRFAADPEAFKSRQRGARKLYTDIHKFDTRDLQHWMDKQVYLNLGQFLLAAAVLGLDATPMEGVDLKVLDAELGLREKGFTSLFVVTVGYRDEDGDYNAKLPKSRLPLETITTML